MLDAPAGRLTPNELISAVLRAPVDLLWNGGIGTYVKASTETNADVGDRANDGVRVNGNELRCRMVVEGGNLGLTQLGRIEYAVAGGLVHTDAIDNAAGVDCSDHEVNIKILLDRLVDAGELTGKQRNQLLESMTDEVADLVLANNRAQTLALLIARRQALPMVNVHARYIDVLETEGWLDRALEFLPTDKQIAERQAAGNGLQTPEFAVLIAYTKNANVAEMVNSRLPDDPALEADLLAYFPARAAAALRGGDQGPSPAARDHRHQGRQPDGEPVGHLVRQPDDRGHRGVRHRRDEGLDRRPRRVPTSPSCGPRSMPSPGTFRSTPSSSCSSTAGEWSSGARCGCCAIGGRRSTSPPRSPSSGPGMAKLATTLEPALVGRMADVVHSGEASRLAAGVPEGLAEQAGVWPLLHTGFDLIELAGTYDRDVADVARVSWELFDRLDLLWLWDGIGALPRSDRWQTQARSALRDDLLSALVELHRDRRRIAR